MYRADTTVGVCILKMYLLRVRRVYMNVKAYHYWLLYVLLLWIPYYLNGIEAAKLRNTCIYSTNIDSSDIGSNVVIQYLSFNFENYCWNNAKDRNIVYLFSKVLWFLGNLSAECQERVKEFKWAPKGFSTGGAAIIREAKASHIKQDYLVL